MGARPYTAVAWLCLLSLPPSALLTLLAPGGSTTAHPCGGPGQRRCAALVRTVLGKVPWLAALVAQLLTASRRGSTRHPGHHPWRHPARRHHPWWIRWWRGNPSRWCRCCPIPGRSAWRRRCHQVSSEVLDEVGNLGLSRQLIQEGGDLAGRALLCHVALALPPHTLPPTCLPTLPRPLPRRRATRCKERKLPLPTLSLCLH